MKSCKQEGTFHGEVLLLGLRDVICKEFPEMVKSGSRRCVWKSQNSLPFFVFESF